MQTITTPTNNSAIALATEQAESIRFDFDTATSSFNRSGNNLEISFDNGSKITLTDFFVVGENGTLPVLVLPDNSQVAGKEFLLSMNPSMDTETAAGPSAATSTSGGAGEYADGTGSITQGVDRLATLSTDQWSKTTNSASFPLTSQVTVSPLAEASTDNTTDGQRPSPVYPADSRMVMILNSSQLTPTDGITFSMAAEAQAQWNPIATGTSLPTWKYGTVSLSNDGKLIFTLAEKYENSVLAGGVLKDNVSYTDATGTIHTIEVVITNNENFNSADRNEWSDTAYETHYGNITNISYDVTSSEGNDHLTYQGSTVSLNADLTGYLNAGTGNDTIVIDGNFGAIVDGTGTHTGLIAGGEGNDSIAITGKLTGAATSDISTTRVEAGLGNDTVNITGEMAFATVDLGTGNDYMSITNSSGIAASSRNDIFLAGTDAASQAMEGQEAATLAMEDFNGKTVGTFNNALIIAGTTGIKADSWTSNSLNVYGGAGKDFVSITGTTGDGIYGASTSNSATLNLGAGDDFLQVAAHTAMAYTKVNMDDGNDTVLIKATNTAMQFSSLHTGNGDDTINITGALSTAVIRSEAGNDDIIVKGNLNRSSIVGGAGSDTIEVTGTLLDGASFVVGDSAEAIYGGTGTNDSLTVGRVAAGGHVIGDSDDSLYGAKGGDDTIYVDTFNSGWVTGDAGGYLRDNSIGGDDSITVVNYTGGRIGGDVGYGMGNPNIASSTEVTTGGNDTIRVTNMSGGTLGGDAGAVLYNSAQGGNDKIYITNLSGGIAAGDAGGDQAYPAMRQNSKGGDDSLYIGKMTGGNVFGDGKWWDSSAKGGNDYIEVRELHSGIVSGDGLKLDNFSNVAGDDKIIIDKMYDGFVYGDAQTMYSSLVGNDYISINEMHTGYVYADSESATSTKGNDTVRIGSLEGQFMKVIDGGTGHDVFVYDNAAGHTLTLGEYADVSIDGDSNYSNTVIFNFEGLGGGSGADILVGNSKANTLMGGAGDDILTGGLGKDTFTWSMGDQGTSEVPAHDVITDFSLVSDVLNLSDLLKGLADTKDEANELLSFSTSGGSTTIHISDGSDIVQNIVLENVTLDTNTGTDAASLLAQLQLTTGF